MEKNFITSSADIEIHRKVHLQDAKMNEHDKQMFKDFCWEYLDVLSNSLDIGKTPLITMTIDTGNHPPSYRSCVLFI